MVDWVQKGRDPAAFPADQRNKDNWQPMLVIEADGTPSLYDQTPFPIRQEQAYIAIGSGRDFAMAAMYLRKTAVEAVEVAIALNSGCGNGIDELRLA
jgi:ATP-dependent protease HslVU (ClpYQ) peptidase subunit